MRYIRLCNVSLYVAWRLLFEISSQTRFLMNFKTFNTFNRNRRVVTSHISISHLLTNHFQIFTECAKLMFRTVGKEMAAARRFCVIIS